MAVNAEFEAALSRIQRDALGPLFAAAARGFSEGAPFTEAGTYARMYGEVYRLCTSRTGTNTVQRLRAAHRDAMEAHYAALKPTIVGKPPAATLRLLAELWTQHEVLNKWM